MTTNLIKAECGDCGGSDFVVYKQEKSTTSILIECKKCKSVSEITVTKPKLEINFHGDSTGRIHFSKDDL